MSVLLFRLNNVPEEEAEAVRFVLREGHIEFYETAAGTFGISVAAIWLRDKEQLERARQLIADFQAEHGERMRQLHRANGDAESFWMRLRREPAKVILYLLAVGLILYISIVPWMGAWD
ncbi:MAG: DUF6164 family protein [Cellvibrionaceae bacterium]